MNCTTLCCPYTEPHKSLLYMLSKNKLIETRSNRHTKALISQLCISYSDTKALILSQLCVSYSEYTFHHEKGLRKNATNAPFLYNFFKVLWSPSLSLSEQTSCEREGKRMNLIRMCHSNAIRQLPWDPEVFSLTNEREAKRRNAREPLGAHVRSFERAWGEEAKCERTSECTR